jgi:hypothetical protein
MVVTNIKFLITSKLSKLIILNIYNSKKIFSEEIPGLGALLLLWHIFP